MVDYKGIIFQDVGSVTQSLRIPHQTSATNNYLGHDHNALTLICITMGSQVHNEGRDG